MKRSLGFWLLLSACAEPAQPVLAPPAPPPAQSAPKPPEAAAPSDEGAVAADQEVAEALELVARVRGLPVKAKVPGVRLGRAALRDLVAGELERETPAEEIAGVTELLFSLDLVAERFDFAATLTALYAQELAGLYDPRKKRMVLASDLSATEAEITLYHELVHALQDQHYDLLKALDWAPERSDVQAAIQALGEGDATAAMLDVALAARGAATTGQIPTELFELDTLLAQASPKLAGVPRVIVRAMIAPYADGLAFVRHLREHAGGWAAVDRAWREQPLSTEHVLHPEKFLAREPVAVVPAIPAPPGFVDASYRDVMGEQGLRLLFEEWAPARSATDAAAGWGGDRLALFRRGEERVVRWHLIFDSADDARVAAVTLARGALRPELTSDRIPERPLADREVAEQETARDRMCRHRTRRGAFALVRQGSHIGVTLGPYRRDRVPAEATGDCALAVAWAEQLVTGALPTP